MKRPVLLSLLCAAAVAVDAPAGEKVLPQRWFFSFGYGRNRKAVVKIKANIRTAAEHGLNDMVLSVLGWDGAKTRFTNCPGAKRLIDPPCREGWTL